MPCLFWKGGMELAEKKLPVSFRKAVSPLESGYIDYEIPDYGTVEKVVMYFAQGQTHDLKVWPVIIQKGTEAPTDIILAAANTERWVYGDGICLEFECSRPVDAQDIIRVFYKSQDATNTMHLSVDVTIDYYAGKVRVT